MIPRWTKPPKPITRKCPKCGREMAEVGCRTLRGRRYYRMRCTNCLFEDSIVSDAQDTM